MKDELNDCIEIESDRLSRRLTIPRQVNFKLTPEAIARLQDFKFDRRKIELNSRQITDLRYYALLNSSLLNKRNNIFQQSGLTFSSCLPIGDRPSSIAIRSKIDLSGRISQEIQQDLWQNSQLLSQVMEVHYWLIEEILRQIPLSTGERLPKRRLNRLSVIVWLCWLPVAIAFTYLLWSFLPFSLLIKAILTILGVLLLKASLTYLIRNNLKSWIIKQLSNGIFSQKYRQRQIGFILLSFIS